MLILEPENTPITDSLLANRISDLFNYLSSVPSFKNKLKTTQTLFDQISEIRKLCIETNDSHLSWLFLASIAGGLPGVSEAVEFHNSVLNTKENDSLLDNLLASTKTAIEGKFPPSNIEFVSNKVLVDVEFTSKNEYLTGIQRVTINLCNEWSAKEEVLFVNWDENRNYIRRLNASPSDGTNSKQLRFFHQQSTMLLPTDSIYFAPEVSQKQHSYAIAGLASQSNNTCVAVGYDLIPIVSSKYVSREEVDKFSYYLSAIKYFDNVISISREAEREFQGFSEMLSAQGITGPSISKQLLPIVGIQSRSKDPKSSQIRKVNVKGNLLLCVGTIEPRKNVDRLLAACELLWREGLQFELMFVGRQVSAQSQQFLNNLSELQHKKRKVSLNLKCDDEELSKLYDSATLLVSVSNHEGFGLPIAEAIAHRLPVIASNSGSVKEVAVNGIHLLTDPDNLSDISSTIKLALTRPSEMNNPVETNHRFPTTWADYASKIWSILGEYRNITK